MSYISPAVQTHFNTLSESLQAEILQKDVQLNTLQDLINVLETIVAEGE